MKRRLKKFNVPFVGLNTEINNICVAFQNSSVSPSCCPHPPSICQHAAMVLEHKDGFMASNAFCLYTIHKITKFYYNVLWQLIDLCGCGFTKAFKYLLTKIDKTIIIKINKAVKQQRNTTHAYVSHMTLYSYLQHRPQLPKGSHAPTRLPQEELEEGRHISSVIGKDGSCWPWYSLPHSNQVYLWPIPGSLPQSFLYHAGLMPLISCSECYMGHEINYFWWFHPVIIPLMYWLLPHLTFAY